MSNILIGGMTVETCVELDAITGLPVGGYASASIASASPVAIGSGYVPADTITLTGGTETTNGILTVATTQVGSITAIANGGTGGTPGAVTLTGTTGTGTKFQATGVISAGGVLTSITAITIAGSYTVNPTSLAAEPVTGGGLTGATLTITMGVLTVTVSTAGAYTKIPANPVLQGSTSGSGTGATFSVVWSGAGYNGATIPVSTAISAEHDVSGSITSGGTAQAISTTNLKAGWRIMNTSIGNLWWNDTGSAAVSGGGSGSWKLTPGAYYESPIGTAPSAISIIGATTGQTFVASVR